MVTGDVIKFTFPSDYTLSTPSCSASTDISSLTCTSSGNTLSASLSFTSSPLTSGTTFAFYVKSISNPPSTKPTSAFYNIVGLDSSGN